MTCAVLPLHISKGSSQLVPRGGQTIEVFAARQLDLRVFCQGTVGMPPDCSSKDHLPHLLSFAKGSLSVVLSSDSALRRGHQQPAQDGTSASRDLAY